jgi:hypothetical protein
MLYGVATFANAGAAYAPGTTNAGAYAYIESNESKIGGGTGVETEYYLGAGSGITVSSNGTITSAAWTQNLAVYLPAVVAGNTSSMFAVL